MATIGLSKPYYALYSASGSTVTYSGGGLLGKAAIIPVPKGDASAFIGLGGRIPAPIHSLKN